MDYYYNDDKSKNPDNGSQISRAHRADTGVPDICSLPSIKMYKIKVDLPGLR